MKSLPLLFVLLLVAAFGSVRADGPKPGPAGIIVLRAMAGYAAAATPFASIQWTDKDGGFVVDSAGAKTPFLNDAIGRVIYFDPVYYDEVDHNQYWVEWRIVMRDREVVLAPIDTTSLRAADAPRLAAEQTILEDTIGRFSISQPVIGPLLAELKDQSAKLSSGLVLQNGQWVAAKDAAVATSTVPVVGDSESVVTFTTKDGKRFENAKVTVTETGISVLTSDGGASVAFDRLPDDLSMFPKTVQDKIADSRRAAEVATAASAPTPPTPGFWDTVKSFFAQVVSWFGTSSPAPGPASAPTPTNAAVSAPAPESPPQPTYPQPASFVASMVSGNLISANGASASTPRSDVRYIAIYYSAQWCPPCHAFTPRLVKWYNAFKPTHANFELIFVSEDHSEADMLNYMKEMSMPWPAVRFDALRHDGSFKGSGIEQYAGDGIPDLVLVDAGGGVLADSFNGSTYVGPEATVDAINRLVGGNSPVSLQ